MTNINTMKIFTLNDPQTRKSPLSLTAAQILSPAAIETARKSSFIKDSKGWGNAVKVSMSKNSPSFSGLGTSFVMRPNAASSFTPQVQIYAKLKVSKNKIKQ